MTTNCKIIIQAISFLAGLFLLCQTGNTQVSYDDTSFSCSSQGCPSCSTAEDIAVSYNVWRSAPQIYAEGPRLVPCTPPFDENGNPVYAIEYVRLMSEVSISYELFIRYCNPNPNVTCPACEEWPKTQCRTMGDPDTQYWEVIVDSSPCAGYVSPEDTDLEIIEA